MSVSAVIKDGKILETASESSVKKAVAKNGMDKEAFLQLLVAQMKYQDPLEPTSNTEYISQYATFAQVEQMQNMAATMELTRASSMVGKMVEIQTTDSSGNARVVSGKVEYVAYENGKAFVSVNGEIYSTDDITAVINEEYQTAFDLAASFVAAMDSLPKLSMLTIDDKESVETIQKGFNSMTAYQQSFISDEYIKKLQKYVERMAELVEAAEKNEGDSSTEGDGDKTEGTEGEGDGDKTEGAENSGVTGGTDKTEEAGGSESESGQETETV